MKVVVIRDNEKQCTSCSEWKHLDNFYKDKRSKFGVFSRCIPCTKIAKMKSTYGLSLQEFEDLIRKQSAKCGICAKPFNLNKRTSINIDHSHRDGKVRGLLCTSCNTSLGSFGDSEEMLQRAIDYLKNAGMK